LLFTHEGGVDVGDVDAKALRLDVAVDETLSAEAVEQKLLTNVPVDVKQ